MFFLAQPEQQQKDYLNFLKVVGGISNLFSDSPSPYLYYRAAERIFCRAFCADDLSRSDVSVDSKKGILGIGLKTFLANNNRSYQKVAEFNHDRIHYENLEPQKLVRKVSILRNERVEFTERVHALEKSIYHCVLRSKGKFQLFEEPMDKIDIEGIRNVKKNQGSISFDDQIHEYSFLISKSTLTKRFSTDRVAHEFAVEILDDPLLELSKLFVDSKSSQNSEYKILQTVFLPLYGRDGNVFEKSGLNQWNAGGRQRHRDEVYIPVPAEIHRNFDGFFPGRDTPFTLKLPNGKEMRSKICQDGSKATNVILQQRARRVDSQRRA